MAATAQMRLQGVLQLAAAPGTRNQMDLALLADVNCTAASGTLAQVEIQPTDGITGDDLTVELRLLQPLISVTADAGTEKLAAASHGLAEGQAVQVTGTALPAPLVAGTTYYVKSPATNDFQLSATVGGSVIDLTTAGTAVKVRALSLLSLSYSYPSTGPAIPPIIRQPGTPLDFSRLRALQVVLMPLNAAANASGSAYLTTGDPADGYNHLSLPLKLAHTAAGDVSWWSAALPMPSGLPLGTDYPMTLKVKAGESNANMLILINLLGY